MKTLPTKLAGFLLLVLLLLGVGCGGNSVTGDASLPDPQVRFFNFSMDSGPVDYYLNEDLKSSTLDYLSSSLDFESVPFIEDFDGAYDISVFKSGFSVPIDSLNTVLQRDHSVAVCAVGLVDPQGEVDKRLQEILIDIDRKKPVGNKSRLVILHAFCRSLGNDTPVINFQTPGDNPLFKASNISFATTSTLTVDSGQQTFEARRGDASGDQIYASKVVNLQAGGLYLVVVSGVEDSTDLARRPRIDFIEMTTKED